MEKKTEKEKSKSKGRTLSIFGDLFENLKKGAKDIIENATKEEEEYNEEDNEL